MMKTHDENDRTRGTWIEEMKKGSNVAWRAFVVRYAPYIGALFRRHQLSENSWEEVEQDILVKLFQGLPGYVHNPKKPNFRCWLATVIRSAVFDHWRKQQRQPSELSKEQLETLCQQGADDCQRLVEEDFFNAVLDEVEKRVSAVRFAAFCMLHRDGKTPDEAAEALKLTRAVVQVYASQVKKQFEMASEEMKRKLD